MKGLYRLWMRKVNARRMLAGAFLVFAFIDIGSHAFTDSYDLAHFEALGFCGIQHDRPLTIDSSTKHKQRSPESNVLDEMTTHAVILTDLALPRCSVSCWTVDTAESVVRPLSGKLTTPFHPPKNA